MRNFYLWQKPTGHIHSKHTMDRIKYFSLNAFRAPPKMQRARQCIRHWNCCASYCIAWHDIALNHLNPVHTYSDTTHLANGPHIYTHTQELIRYSKLMRVDSSMCPKNSIESYYYIKMIQCIDRALSMANIRFPATRISTHLFIKWHHFYVLFHIINVLHFDNATLGSPALWQQNGGYTQNPNYQHMIIFGEFNGTIRFSCNLNTIFSHSLSATEALQKQRCRQ